MIDKGNEARESYIAETDASRATIASKNEEPAVGKDERKPRRRRSNRPYPPSSFEEAVKCVREVYEFNSGLAVRKLSFFDHLGRSPDSSEVEMQ